jgi:hypothetical protein
MLSDNDADCGVINLTLCLVMYESPLHQTKVQRKTTTRTPTSHEKCRVEEATLLQNHLLLEGPLFFD